MPPEENNENGQTEESVKVEDNGGRLYRHKTVRRFRAGEFEFKNYHLRTEDAEQDARFNALMQKLPRIDTADIVQVNEEARDAAESPIVRGAMGAEHILTAKDREKLAASTQGGAAKTGLSGFPQK